MPVIHRFWAGPKELPAEYAYFGEQWGVLNPGYILRMWSWIQPGEDASSFIEGLPEEATAVHHWGHKKDGRSNTVETATQ